MEKIREWLMKPWVAAGIAFVLGLIIGLVVLGWWLFPVQWTDASAANLRPDLQTLWMQMSIVYYNETGDVAVAKQTYDELGPQAPIILAELAKNPDVKPDQLANYTMAVTGNTAAVTKPAQTKSAQTKPAQTKPAQTKPAQTQVAGTQEAQGKATPTGAGAEEPTAIMPLVTPTSSSSGILSPAVLLVVFCLLTLLIGAALVYVLFLRKRSGGGGLFPASTKASSVNKQVERTDYATSGQEPPIAQFMTTYMMGDDLYDDSFSIDSPTGEFLGECGVGMSETIGVGEPKKVSAFEVWLFDKNDIQTVTKVLMSDHVFNDPAVSQRLASKGEPVLIEPGKRILLETATLQLEARVVDMNYGQGALPENSYLERMTLELAIWQKPGG